MKTEVLIVLGSINSHSGELSQIATDRLNYCLSIYSKSSLILCTGGWGSGFNTSSNSHAAYAKSYLIEHGILETDFLEFAISSHTVEDAVMIKPIIARFKHLKINIITSDFHLARVKLIFKEIMKGIELHYIGVPSTISKETLKVRRLHEKKSIETIIKNGLYF